MGISISSLQMLLREASRRPFSGSILTLGRQDIAFTYDALVKNAQEYGIKLCNPGENCLAAKPNDASRGCISDECLYKALGFSNFKAMDCSDFESAHIIFDLNKSQVPQDLVGTFDCILNGGTIEHVFHLPNALNNLYKMLRVGGRIIHIAPSSNYIDHGFVMFSPTFFLDFYKANHFEINTIQLIRHTQQAEMDPWHFYDYTSGSLDHLSFGRLDNAMYAIVCIVTKTNESTGDAIPQQGLYVRIHEGAKQGSQSKVESPPLIQLSGTSSSLLLLSKSLRLADRSADALTAIKNSIQLKETSEALSELIQVYDSLGLHKQASKIANYLKQKFPEIENHLKENVRVNA